MNLWISFNLHIHWLGITIWPQTDKWMAMIEKCTFSACIIASRLSNNNFVVVGFELMTFWSLTQSLALTIKPSLSHQGTQEGKKTKIVIHNDLSLSKSYWLDDWVRTAALVGCSECLVVRCGLSDVEWQYCRESFRNWLSQHCKLLNLPQQSSFWNNCKEKKAQCGNEQAITSDQPSQHVLTLDLKGLILFWWLGTARKINSIFICQQENKTLFRRASRSWEKASCQQKSCQLC